MSRKLIGLNSDLKRLEDDGLDLEIKNGLLLVYGIPYVNEKCEIKFGIIVSKLELSAEKTSRPEDHVVHFIGDHPCRSDGKIITAIQNASSNKDLGNGIIINHTFSNKPNDRKYYDYYEKITQYLKIISNEAQAVDPAVKPLSKRNREENQDDEIFLYPDTNSSRAEIGAIAAKLRNLKIAIIGLGGTGSYVLDFVAKTPVQEIHLFDSDVYLNHNAFRAPGAASIKELDKKLKKVFYLNQIYSRMRRFIVPHECHITLETIEKLSEMDFVFVCIDSPTGKKVILDALKEKQISFVDVGMGVTAVDNALTGSIRTTTYTRKKGDHINDRVSLGDEAEDDFYSLNIQIAELNALNAALAVIKWKKLFGFYHDLEREHHSSYSINVNKLVNDETDS